MRTLKTLVVALMALAWVTATAHCQFEVLAGLEFLRCASDVQGPTDGGDDCNDRECCSVESAKYQFSRQQEISPVVALAIVPVADSAVLEQSLPVEVSLGILTAAPPELQASWQFSLRTALPVRAPSLAS
jgi:hypothetical protein